MDNGLSLKKKKIKISRKKILKRFNYIKNKQSMLIVLVGIFVVLLFALIRANRYFFIDAKLNIEDRVKSLSIGNGFPYKIDGQKIFADNFEFLNGNIVALSDTSFQSFTLSGKQISSRPHNFSNPAMKLCGNKALIYDIGGCGYRIESCCKTIFNKNAENKIICGDITNNGTYAILTESPIYLSQISIFNRANKERFKYSFADCYVSNLALKDDGKGASVCGFSSTNGKIFSLVYIFDFSYEFPKGSYEFDDMIVSIKYLSNKKLLCIGQKSMWIIDISKDKKQEISYDLNTLKCIDANNDSGILLYCLSSSSNDKNCELILLDKSGKIKLKKEISESLTYISYDNGKILGIAGENLLIYNTNGEMENKIYIGNNINKVLKISNSKTLTVDNEIIREICNS